MVLAQLLEALGLGGGLVLLVMGLFALYHLRSGMQLASKIETWIMATAIFAVLLLAGEAGLVPGLDPDLGRLIPFLMGLAEQAWQLGWGVLEGWLL